MQAMTPGANYVGAVPQTFNPAIPAYRRAAAAVGHILREFIAGIGIPLYQGRIKARSKVFGFFRPSVHEVRIRNANDLETTAHEMAHYLDRVIPEDSAGQWKPASNANAPIRAELAGVSYDKNEALRRICRVCPPVHDSKERGPGEGSELLPLV